MKHFINLWIRLTEKEAMLCAFTSARAFAELHAVGIVHGDISSENILIDPHTLSAKLIDFDMASIEGTSM